jgi:hypothetical protein
MSREKKEERNPMKEMVESLAALDEDSRRMMLET